MSRINVLFIGFMLFLYFLRWQPYFPASVRLGIRGQFWACDYRFSSQVFFTVYGRHGCSTGR